MTTLRADGAADEPYDADGLLADAVAVENHDTRCETEPNDLPDGEPIELPVTISGRIEKPRDVDAFRFEARKGESLAFRLESRALGYPLDAVLAITDATGRQLARVDDLPDTRDASLTFCAPADGSYCVVVSDLNRQGSPRHVYRLRAARSPTSISRPTPFPTCSRRPSRSRSPWPWRGKTDSTNRSVSASPGCPAL